MGTADVCSDGPEADLAPGSEWAGGLFRRRLVAAACFFAAVAVVLILWLVIR